MWYSGLAVRTASRERKLRRGKPGLLADAEPKDGDEARPRAADRFQVYPRDPRRREANAVAEQHRQYVHEDLVDEPPPQALAGHVGTEDLQVLAARSVQRGGNRLPDVTGEVRDLRAGRLRRPMGEDEHRSGEGVVDGARLLCFHPGAYVPGPPAYEHGAGGCRDPRELVRGVVGQMTRAPVHRIPRTGDEAVERHRPVHDDLAVRGAPIAHTCSSEEPRSASVMLDRNTLALSPSRLPALWSMAPTGPPAGRGVLTNGDRGCSERIGRFLPP